MMIITIEKLLSQADGKVEVWIDNERKWTARTQVPDVWQTNCGSVFVPAGSQAVLKVIAIDKGTIIVK